MTSKDKELEDLVEKKKLELIKKQSFLDEINDTFIYLDKVKSIKTDAMRYTQGKVIIKPRDKNNLIELNEEDSDFIIDSLIKNYEDKLRRLKEKFVV